MIAGRVSLSLSIVESSGSHLIPSASTPFKLTSSLNPPSSCPYSSLDSSISTSKLACFVRSIIIPLAFPLIAHFMARCDVSIRGPQAVFCRITIPLH
ncbi:hypothetical protein BJX64DRAFT_87943 [Aspergillus heterothallicus]